MASWNPFEAPFTAPGTNARRGQEKQIRDLAKQLAKLFNANYGNANAQVERQGATLDATYQQLQQLLGTLGQGGTDARIANFNANADSQAAQDQAAIARELGNAGLGDGAILGAKRRSRNAAASAKNGFFAQEYDPTNIANRLQAGQNAAGNWMNMSNSPMNSLLQLFGGVNGQQPVQVQPGVGDYMGQAAAAYFGGMGAGKAGKAGKEQK